MRPLKSLQDLVGSGGLVKICGLREPEHAAAAASAGADLLGFIFAPARRRVTVGDAGACIQEARRGRTGRQPLAVGVFVDATLDEMNRAAESADLDLLQLHGDEPPELLRELSRPVIKAVRPLPGTTSAEIRELIARYADVANAPLAYLIDGFSSTAAGGEGVRADWEVAREIARCYPVVLAGGLAADSVEAGIVQCAPLGVDVSSGVERGAVKDSALIAAFVDAAKRAFATN